MNLRDKIKATQMRLVELASYLNVSRPTLYRYLELYENKEYNEIDKKCFDLFSFIDNAKSLKRPLLMDYLINKVLPVESTGISDVEILSNVRKLSLSHNDLDIKKMNAIEILASSSKFDEILDFLLAISKTKTKITVETVKKIVNKGE